MRQIKLRLKLFFNNIYLELYEMKFYTFEARLLKMVRT